jgi:hypothetical protein
MALCMRIYIESPRNKLRGISDWGRNRKPRLVGGVKERN